MTIFHVLFLCFLNSTICLRVCSIKGFPDYFFKIKNIGNSLTVDSPLVRTRHFHCGSLGSSPCWGTKIQQATWCGQNTNCKKTHHYYFYCSTVDTIFYQFQVYNIYMHYELIMISLVTVTIQSYCKIDSSLCCTLHLCYL